MSRLRRLLLTDTIFFVTCDVARNVRCMSAAERALLMRTIGESRQRLRFRLMAYVVMPNHWHALILPAPGQSISDILHDIKRVSALRFNRRRRRSGPFWQSRYFDSFMRTVQDYRDTLEYIHSNPVRDGFVRDHARWPWSSYRQYLGEVGSVLPIDHLELPLDPKHRL